MQIDDRLTEDELTAMCGEIFPDFEFDLRTLDIRARVGKIIGAKALGHSESELCKTKF